MSVDDELRSLEVAARLGDAFARMRLQRTRERAGKASVREVVEAAAAHGWTILPLPLLEDEAVVVESTKTIVVPASWGAVIEATVPVATRNSTA